MKDKKLSSTKKKYAFYKVILYQIFICLIICLLMFILKLFFINKYYYVGNSIKRATSGETAFSFFQKTLYNVKYFLSNATKANSNVKNEKEQPEQKEKSDVENKEEAVKTEQKTVSLDLENETSIHDDDDVMFINFKLPLKGKISSKFGFRPNPLIKGKTTFHHGVDIGVIDGTPVLSIGDGIVKKISNSRKSGKYVSIKHGDIYESLYAHCSKIFVSPGNVVKKGDRIALSGRSGNVTGAHLHLGIKKNGSWIDPAEIFPNLL